jgi:class 3 adenylate cyclase/tetratricopeptide (TPR) repeat protein
MAGGDEAPLAESRWISVLDVDLVGFTTLSERYPDAMPRLVTEFQRAARRAIDTYGGEVKNVAGDGVTAVFGFPRAVEGTARRSVLAAQQIQESIDELSQTMESEHGFTVALRAGVDSGRVRLIEGYQEAEMVGQAMNRASRIQAAAEPGSVFVSEAIRDQLEPDFVFVDRGPFELKGFSEAIPLFEAVGPAPSARVLGPMVGRAAEEDAVRTLWAAKVSGGPDSGAPVLLLTGQAGIGKSRLIAFAQELAAEHGLVRVGDASPYQTTASFHAIGRMLANQVAPDPATPDEVRLKGLISELELAGFVGSLAQRPVLPLLAPLIGLKPPLFEQPQMEPDKLFEETMKAVDQWWTGLARRGPLALFIEDVHWAEPSTVRLIDRVINAGLPSNALLIITVRDEAFGETATKLATKDRAGFEERRSLFRAWTQHPNVQHLHLERLDAAATVELARSMRLDRHLSDEVLEEALRDFGGVPLYVEELVRTVATVPGYVDTSGHLMRRRPELAPGEAPTRLHDILLTRLESAGVDLSLAQRAAAIGRRPSLDLLAAISDRSIEEMAPDIDALVQAGVFWPPAEDDTRVEFRHVLIRDEAYETMVEQRAEVHKAIARELVKRHGNPDPNAEESVAPAASAIAFHMEQAGQPDAVPWHIAAGRYAQSRGANEEAITTLDHAMDLMADWPGGPAPFAELLLRLTRGTAWAGIEGYGSPHAQSDYEHSEALSVVMTGMPERGAVLLALWSYLAITGERARAGDLLEQLRDIAENDSFVGPMIRAEYESAAGVHYNLIGDYDKARRHYEAALEAFESRRRAGEPMVFPAWSLPNDPLIACYAQLVHLYWAQGDAAKSAHAAAAASERFEEVHYPLNEFSRAWLIAAEGFVLQLAGEVHAAAGKFAAMKELSDRHGFTMWSGLAETWQRIGEAIDQPTDEALDAIAAARSQIAALGVASYQPTFFAAEAELRERLGEPQRGLDLYDQAIAQGEATEERSQEAEIYRQRSGVRVRTGDLAGGVADLEKAYAIALEQGAHLYRLRAAIDLMGLPEGMRPEDGATRLEDALGEIAQPDAYPEAAAARKLLAG